MILLSTEKTHSIPHATAQTHRGGSINNPGYYPARYEAISTSTVSLSLCIRLIQQQASWVMKPLPSAQNVLLLIPMFFSSGGKDGSGIFGVDPDSGSMLLMESFLNDSKLNQAQKKTVEFYERKLYHPWKWLRTNPNEQVKS